MSDVATHAPRHRSGHRSRHGHRSHGISEKGEAQRSHLLDVAIECLLGISLAFAPLAFGVVEAWSEEIFIAIAASTIICFCLRILSDRNFTFTFSYAYVPIGLFLALAALQLAPLPSRIVGFISPNTTALRSELLGMLPNATEILRKATATFYPAATRHDLRLLLALSGIFVVVLNTYKRVEQIRRLLFTVLAIALVIAGIALAQDFTDSGDLYWARWAGRVGANSGTFVSHNHFGQFMNLSLGCGVALFLLAARNKSKDHWGRTPARLASSLRLPILAFFLATFVILGVITVFLSGSRGAMVGLLSGLVLGVLAFFSIPSRHGAAWAWVAIPITLAACTVALFVSPDTVHQRLATLEHSENYANRFQILRNLTTAWREFPAIGAGLGTHQFVYPMFQRGDAVYMTVTHAENEYAQVLEETGVSGLVIIVAFLATVCSAAIGALRSSDRRVRCMAAGLGMGLVAVLVQSFCDFGQHLAANAQLSAIGCALLVRLSRPSHSHHHNHAQSDSSPASDLTGVDNLAQVAKRHIGRWNWPIRAGASLAAISLCFWAVLGSKNAAAAEYHWLKASATEQLLKSENWNATNQQYAELLSEASAASSLAPDNVLYRYSLDSYRWHSISRIQDPESGNIIVGPRGLDACRRIVADLCAARTICPTYAHLYALTGQLQMALLKDHSQGAADLRLAFKLDQNDPWICATVAALDAEDGNYAQAQAVFRRSLELGNSFSAITQAFAVKAKQPGLALDLAHGNPDYLEQLADSIAGYDPILAASARAESFQIHVERTTRPDASTDDFLWLAKQSMAAKDYPAAVAAYRAALARDYANFDLHLALANLLSVTGRVPEAIQEVRICLRLSPESKDARTLAGNLYLRPETQAADPSTAAQ